MRLKTNTVEDYFYSFDKTKIYYEIQGSLKNKNIILFLHGLGGNVTAWDPHRKFFSQLGFTTIAMDLRGHGLSGRPKKKTAYALENFAKDVDLFLKLYKLQNIVIAGQCIGGMVTIILNGQFHIPCKSIILIGTGYKLPSYLSMLERPKTLSVLSYALNRFPMLLGKPGHPYLLKFKGTDTIDLRRFASDVFYTTAQSYVGICSNVFSFNGYNLLSHISSPTLIIHGTNDIFFPIASAEDLQKHIANSKLIFIPKANHILVINNPEDINHHIENYLFDTV